eukprot:gene1468-1705_t
MLNLFNSTSIATPSSFDIIVHAAGITQNSLFMRTPDDTIRSIIDVNVMAPMLLTRALIKPMVKQQWGRIIFLGSVVGHLGNRGQTIYGASKAALEGFSKSLSREVGHANITSNVIAPGYINTDMSAAFIESQGSLLTDRISLKKIGDVKDIAKTALFIIESEYITGQVIHVDGGLH